ncbi:hypothetical protein EVG20_g7942 [Dentipellis fragilis]|uniref:Uncharacterized protein n=1 Tax=Dentipellis fragilis TaxID=205917 RepID=A0A4Y9YAF4_9AGAM|nr:hypothetical protein EVG20_g7942 [Dentipellis fragilis]
MCDGFGSPCGGGKRSQGILRPAPRVQDWTRPDIDAIAVPGPGPRHQPAVGRRLRRMPKLEYVVTRTVRYVLTLTAAYHFQPPLTYLWDRAGPPSASSPALDQKILWQLLVTPHLYSATRAIAIKMNGSTLFDLTSSQAGNWPKHPTRADWPRPPSRLPSSHFPPHEATSAPRMAAAHMTTKTRNSKSNIVVSRCGRLKNIQEAPSRHVAASKGQYGEGTLAPRDPAARCCPPALPRWEFCILPLLLYALLRERAGVKIGWIVVRVGSQPRQLGPVEFGMLDFWKSPPSRRSGPRTSIAPHSPHFQTQLHVQRIRLVAFCPFLLVDGSWFNLRSHPHLIRPIVRLQRPSVDRLILDFLSSRHHRYNLLIPEASPTVSTEPSHRAHHIAPASPWFNNDFYRPLGTRRFKFNMTTSSLSCPDDWSQRPLSLSCLDHHFMPSGPADSRYIQTERYPRTARTLPLQVMATILILSTNSPRQLDSSNQVDGEIYSATNQKVDRTAQGCEQA